MYQVIYFKNSRYYNSSLKPGYVTRAYPSLNMAVYNEELFSFNEKSMKRILTLEDLTLIPTGYFIARVNDWESAYSYFLSQRISILNFDSDDKRIVVEIPNNFTIDNFKEEIDKLSFVDSTSIDYIFEVTPLSNRFLPVSSRIDERERFETHPNISYDSVQNWALQNAHSREAWNLINENATSNSPVTVTMFDTRVDTGHPDLKFKIDPTSVNYMAIYENNNIISTYDNGTTTWVNVNWEYIRDCGLYVWNGWWGAQPSDPGYFNSAAGYRLRQYLHGTGVAGVLGGSNSNNILISSPSNDCVKIRVAVVVDVFRSDLDCGQMAALLSASEQPTFSTTLVWEMATTRESFYYQPDTAAYVLGWDLTNADPFVRGTLFNTFSYRLQYNREGRGAALFAAHGNDNTNQSGLGDSAPPHAGDENVYYVSSSNIYDFKSPFSNYGIYNHFAAPGENVLTASVRGKYGDDNYGLVENYGFSSSFFDNRNANYDMKQANGTSISAAFLAAVYATMVYTRPTLTNFQAINILRETSRKVGGYLYDGDGRSIELGYGIVDHEAAIQGVIELSAETYDWPGGEPIEVNITDSPPEIYDQLVEGVGSPNAPRVEFIVDILDPQVVPLVRKITSKVYICDEEWFDYPNSCVLAGQQDYIITGETNTEDSFNTFAYLLNNCELSTGSKQIFVKSQVFGYGNWPISYGLASDNIGVEVVSGDNSLPYIRPHSQWCALNGISLQYLGIVPAGNGQSTSNASGIYWKFRIEMPIPADYPYSQKIYGIIIRILKLNQISGTWDWVTSAYQIVWDGQIYSFHDLLLLDPSVDEFGSGMGGGDFRERLFVFNDFNNILGQLIAGLPVQMRAEIASVSIGLDNGEYQWVDLDTLTQGTNLRTDFTIDSWPGLTSPSGTNFG